LIEFEELVGRRKVLLKMLKAKMEIQGRWKTDMA
jgi:hypothetical protein